MLVVKMGKEHIDMGINCQDFALENDKFKMIVDGCSSCINSEIGAKLFCHLFPKAGYDITRTFNVMRALYDTDEELLDNLLFTILMVNETDLYFDVNVCGDGYVIAERWDGTIEYQEFDFDNAPPYYAYNLMNNKDRLSKYRDGVEFQNFKFSKLRYKNIGVSSDGIRYILAGDHKQEFETLLKQGRPAAIKRFVNRNIQEFKDDISVVF
jgi:hypothetical protein